MPTTSRCVALVPVASAINPSCEDGLRELERRGYAVWRVQGYSAIDAARNQMASDALAQGFDELMWIDADIVFDPDDVDKLRRHELPLVCGIYPKNACRQFACAFLPQTRQVAFGNQGGLLEILYGFIQLFHKGWDQHTNLPKQIVGQCRDTDQPTAALIADLKQRGLLDDTLLIWGGEFGRTVYCQGTLTAENYGRDHHPRCFTVFLAGAGIKAGLTHGETDDFCYNITRDPVHVHDLHATMLHCLGIEHTRLTFLFQGRHHRLTDVHGNVVKGILA